VAEQRYRAVLEAGAGIAVTEVAERYGVSRQSAHTWLVRYRQEGIARLEDRGTLNPAPAPGVDQHLSGPSRATKR
jgi:transposase